MNIAAPPRLAMFLLDCFGSPYQRESLSGDLIEQFQKNRSSAWVWREVLCAIAIARLRSIYSWRFRAKTLLRVINAIMLAAAIALGVGTLTRADSPHTRCLPQIRC